MTYLDAEGIPLVIQEIRAVYRDRSWLIRWFDGTASSVYRELVDVPRGGPGGSTDIARAIQRKNSYTLFQQFRHSGVSAYAWHEHPSFFSDAELEAQPSTPAETASPAATHTVGASAPIYVAPRTTRRLRIP